MKDGVKPVHVLKAQALLLALPHYRGPKNSHVALTADI